MKAIETVDDVPHKRCPKCEKSLPATPDFFYRANGRKDGLFYCCRTCAKDIRDAKDRREESARYYQANKERIISRVTQYEQTHKEDKHARQRKYEQAHKKEIAAYKSRYNRTEQGRMVSNARVNRRRSLRKAAPGSYTPEQFAEQVKRQKNKCYWCGKKLTEIHADHIVPLSRPGATNYIDNIVAACPTCNMKRNNKLPHEWSEGGRLL